MILNLCKTYFWVAIVLKCVAHPVGFVRRRCHYYKVYGIPTDLGQSSSKATAAAAAATAAAASADD